MNDISITDSPESHRYQLRVGDTDAAHAEYKLLKGAIKFTHTEVPPEFEGKGLGSQLAKFALDDVRQRGLQVIPECQFIAGYIRRHTEYLDLVSEENRRAFKV
ncbi:MAG: GNAT family N-acetyltransferase [Ramlibacter sp.]